MDRVTTSNRNQAPPPILRRHRCDEIAYWTDEALRQSGVIVAFSERTGGVSSDPYDSLNLAAHVGDDPHAVDENRMRLLDALGLGSIASALTVPEQVHGSEIVRVDGALAGHGARASSGPQPIPSTDAVLTGLPGVPLLLCFADCVPVVLVAPGPAIAVVHTGWRGALQRLPGLAAVELAAFASCSSGEIRAYVGAHICAGCYRVGAEIMSQFIDVFGTVAQAESEGLDLRAIVHASLTDAGVPPCSIASLGACTAEETDRWFSYRAEGGLTGRHGAIACILP